MTDEEKEAIEHLTKKMKYHKDNPLDTYVWLTLDEHYVRIILNLIEKQSKEIEELKNGQIDFYISDKEIEDRIKNIIVNKIKAKIEELQEDIKYSANPLSIDNSKFGIKVLQSLLEEKE